MKIKIAVFLSLLTSFLYSVVPNKREQMLIDHVK